MNGHQELLLEFERVADPGSRADEVMQHISDRLHSELLRYNWVGFYLVDTADPNYLLLGPHAGVFTPHIRISLDQGLCGAAARLGEDGDGERCQQGCAISDGRGADKIGNHRADSGSRGGSC